MIEFETSKHQFIKIVHNTILRGGIEDLLDWLDNTDFYEAPASTRFHGAHTGGLVEHSLAVYNRLQDLAKFYEYGIEESMGVDQINEKLAIVALFHDLCKVGYYKTDLRWRKDKNQRWEQYATYKTDEDFAFGGHGSKSMFLVMNFIHLEPDEAAAINCHMGAWDSSTYSNPSKCYEDNKLAWLLHVADEAATYLDKK